MADWSDLPFDLLERLTGFLPLPDYHRFSSVCQNWWTVAKQRRYSPAKQLPWLLVQEDSDPRKCRVFSISENRHYNINFPELEGQYVCSSSYGWLFTVDIDLNIKLLNPLTGKCYELPPLRPFYERVKGYVTESRIPHEQAQICFVDKAILDHDPSQRSDFTVLIMNGFFKRTISFWRLGNLGWTRVKDDSCCLVDIAYLKGKFYACDTYFDMAVEDCENDTNATYVVDVGPNRKATRIGPEVPVFDEDDKSRTYLVDFRGELLLVQMWIPEIVWIPEIEMDRSVTKEIIVYKLDLEEGKYYVRHHLDGYSLFLGKSSPLVIDPGQFPGCKENCIYFAPHNNSTDRDDDGIYDMLKGIVSPYYPLEMHHPNGVDPIFWTPNPW